MEQLPHVYTAYGVPKELADRDGAKNSFLYRFFGHEIMMLTTTGYPGPRVLQHPNYVEWEKESFEPYVHDVICFSEWTEETVHAIVFSAARFRRIREAGYPIELLRYAYEHKPQPIAFVEDLMAEGMPPEYTLALVQNAAH